MFLGCDTTLSTRVNALFFFSFFSVFLTQFSITTISQHFLGCGLTVKGQYYAPGRNPPLGERKLFLYIEGTSAEEVRKAKLEIKRILEEAQIPGKPDTVQYGKYTVV